MKAFRVIRHRYPEQRLLFRAFSKEGARAGSGSVSLPKRSRTVPDAAQSPDEQDQLFGSRLRKRRRRGPLAMQKVVGSNPISRFARDLALGRDFVASGGAKGKWNPPLLSPPFWALVPKMTPMRGD